MAWHFRYLKLQGYKASGSYAIPRQWEEMTIWPGTYCKALGMGMYFYTAYKERDWTITIVSSDTINMLACKNCINDCPCPQELHNSKEDCITYIVPCISW